MSAPVIITSVDAYVKALLHCYKYPTQPIMGFLIGKYLNTHHTTQSSATSLLEEDKEEQTSSSTSATATAKEVEEKEVVDKSHIESNDNSLNKNNDNNNKTNTSSTSSSSSSSSKLPKTAPEHVQSPLLSQNQIGSEFFGPHSCYVTDAVPLFHTLPMTYPHPMVDVALAHTMSIAKTSGLSLLGVYVANERCNDRTLSPLLRPLLEALQTRLTKNHKLLLWMVDNQTLQSPPLSLSICTLFYPGSEIIEKGIALPPPSAPNVMTLQSCQVQSSTNNNSRTGTINASINSNSVVGEDNTTNTNNSKSNKNDTPLSEDMTNLDVSDKSTKKKTNAQSRNARRNKNNGGRRGKTGNTNKGNNDDYKDDYDYDEDEDMGEDSIMLDLWFGQWNSATLMPERNILLESAIDAVGNALSTFAHYKIVDFEEHLENPRLNYLEQPLEQLMRK